MIKEQDLSDLLHNRKLIELCNKINYSHNSDYWTINKWCEKEGKEYILPLKTGSSIDETKILCASCIVGIRLVQERVTPTQLRRLLNGFQIVREEIKKSGLTIAQISKLKLNLAYVTARNSNIRTLTDLLDSLLDRERFPENANMDKQFDLVVTLLEGVIAYHKLSGGHD